MSNDDHTKGVIGQISVSDALRVLAYVFLGVVGGQGVTQIWGGTPNQTTDAIISQIRLQMEEDNKQTELLQQVATNTSRLGEVERSRSDTEAFKRAVSMRIDTLETTVRRGFGALEDQIKDLSNKIDP